MNSHGAAEYATGYASKGEAPDQKKMLTILTKALTNLNERGPMVTDRQRLSIAAKSVVGSTQVGSVQAIYFILNHDFVISSRKVIHVNPKNGKILLNFLFSFFCDFFHFYSLSNSIIMWLASTINIPLQSIPYPGDSELTPASNFCPNSARGRRKAYESVVKSQWEKFSACNIRFLVF